MANKPDKLKIARRGDTGNKYTATWKPDKDFTAQRYAYGYTVKLSNGTKKTDFTVWHEIGKATDSINFGWDKDKFYPYTTKKIIGVDFKVQGKTKKNGWKNDTAWETYKISKPPEVKITDAWSSSDSFKSKFVWGLANKNWGQNYLNEHQYVRYQYRTKIREKLNADSVDELNKWFKNQKTGVEKGTGSSWSKRETNIGSKFMDRAIQVRAQGPWGDGDWTAKRHAYGNPPPSTNIETTETTINKVRQTMQGVISWDFNVSAYRVVDQILIEYLIDVPAAGLKPPANKQWNPLETFYISGGTGNSKRKTKTDSYEWEIHQLLEPNQCLWLRVSSINDNNKTDGVPVLKAVGKLASPSDIIIDPDPESHRIAVSATNNAMEVEDSFLVVVYHDSSGKSEYEDKALAIIPHNKTSITFQAPDWGDNDIGVEVYAVAAASIQETEENGIKVYNIAAWSYRYHGLFNGELTCEIPCPEYPYNTLGQTLSLYLSGNSLVKNVSVEAYDNTGYLITPVLNDFPAGVRFEQTFPIGAVLDVSGSTPVLTVSALPAAQAVEAYFSFTLYQDSKSYMTSERGAESTSVSVPKAPNSVTAVQLGDEPKVQVTWDVPWDEADGAEVSWADHDDAWYSTASPSTHDVDNVHNPILNIADVALGSRWYIRVRLYKNTTNGGRIYGPYKDANEELGYCDLSSSPNIPVLELSDNIISEFGNTTASWVYVSNDTTDQSAAKLFEIIEGEEPQLIAEVTTAQHVVLYPEEIGWKNDSSHDIALQVFSESGNASELSDVQTLEIAAPLHCQITSFSPTFVEDIEDPSTYSGSSVTVPGGTEGHEKEVANLIVSFTYTGSKIRGTTVTINGNELVADWSNTADNVYGGTYDLVTGVLTSTLDSTGSQLQNSVVYEFRDSSVYLEVGDNVISANNGNVQVKTCTTYFRSYELREMPFDFTVIGAGEGSYTYITIERAENYVAARPNDITTFGARGEVVCQFVYSGEMPQSIETLDKRLSGYLDDGADYIFTAMIQDSLGQVSTVSRNLSVRWNHQARIPSGTVTIQDGIAIITPVAPPNNQGWSLGEGDYADIYRLTADKPQLVYSGAEFGTAYVDPYPTIGKEGGYRIVFVTANGDYITDEYTDASGDLVPTTNAWYDIRTDSAIFNTKFQLIDYGGTEIEFKYNVTLDNTWKKKFTQTNYLGGSTIGDWDAGTDFSTSISGNTFYDIEPEVYEQLRDLADYSGICHLRTIDGTNICCNIEVTDNSKYNSLEHQHDISLSIQKVDNPELDGMSLEEWNYGEE